MKIKDILLSSSMVLLPAVAQAITVEIDSDASVLASATLSSQSGVTIVSGSEALIGAETQQGTYSDFNFGAATGSGAEDLALDNGVVLTTGNAGFSTQGNSTPNLSDTTGTGADPLLVDLASDNGLNTFQLDTNILTFDFVLDDTDANAVTADFLFATDEFPTESVTDIMGIFVNGVNYAFFPNGDLVSNQGGDPNDFFNDNSFGLGTYDVEFNGLTSVFSVTGLAEGNGAVNTLSIAIADTSDTLFDSALFFAGLSASNTSGDGGIGPVPDDDPVVPNPVPLPAAGWLLLAGLGGLGVARRRKRRG